MKIYIMRHGQTDWNAKYLLQGQVDTPLNEEGIRQVSAVAQALKHIDFDICYTSPLVRAFKTAEIMMGSRPAPIIQDDRLIEFGFGVLEGETVDFRDNHTSFFDSVCSDLPFVEGAESFFSMRSRCEAFIKDCILLNEKKYKHVLITAHGLCIRQLTSLMRGEACQDFWNDTKKQVNGAITTVDLLDGVFSIEGDKVAYY